MSSSESEIHSKVEISQVEDEWYYCSDTSDTDTFYLEEEEIICGFVRNTDSSSDSDKDISDDTTKCQFPVKDIDFHGMEQELLKLNTKQKDILQIYPESHRNHLQHHHPEILKSLDVLLKEGATVAYVSPSVAEDLERNYNRRPRDVVCDVCIFNPQKPVMVLTFTSTDELSSKLMRHNSKAARAFRDADAASMMSKECNPQTLSKNASHKFAYLEEDQGCGPKPDLECDGHSDDDIEDNYNINGNITHQGEVFVQPDVDSPKQSNTSSRKRVSECDIRPSLDLKIPRYSSHLRYQNPNLNKTVDARSTKHIYDIVKIEIKRFHLSQNQNESKQHIHFCDESNHANGISAVQRTNKVSLDATSVHNGQTELSLKGGILQNVTVTEENLQQVNEPSDEDTSQFLDVDHDVLRDISVISSALTKDEWKNPKAFLEKVKGLETLAREVELAESLEMDRDTYVQVLKSFFSRLSALNKRQTPMA